MTQPFDPDHPPRMSKLAIFAFALSFLAFCTSCIAGIPAIILGSIALARINKEPHRLAGAGYAKTGISVAFIGTMLSLLVYVLFSWVDRSPGLSHRSACAANIKSIMTMMAVYGNENNDHLPLGAPPAELFTYSNQLAINSGQTSANETLKFMQSPQMAGYVHSPLWILVLTQQVSPKSFLCREDPFILKNDPAPVFMNGKEYYASFQKPNQISYSVAYPWAKNPVAGKIEAAKYWYNSVDSNLPLMSDMAPLAGTGKPPRDPNLAPKYGDLKSKGQKAANSFNHDGAGMNVGFADAHAEWTRTPRLGQKEDNIFTSSGIPGIEPDVSKPPRPGRVEPITTTATPFDIVMVPLRDGKTGEMK